VGQSDLGSSVVAEEVRDALRDGVGIVALETTLLVHGLPADTAVKVAGELDAAVRANGAVPATIGVLAGVATVGIPLDGVARLVADRASVRKLSSRDLGLAAAARVDGATTVAATITLAAGAAISVMATGGIGGVHLGASETFDESADLVAMARTPVLVVASGAKSILDVPATLERLDTLGVAVASYGTTSFPGFYVRDAGVGVDWTVSTPEEAADAFLRHRGFTHSGMLLANPIPEIAEMDTTLHANVLADALHDAHERGVSGADVTPFLLSHFASESMGESVLANVALVVANAALAARVATAIAVSTTR
jgi:pseudouridine-5'-phosphate glycosidase